MTTTTRPTIQMIWFTVSPPSLYRRDSATHVDMPDGLCWGKAMADNRTATDFGVGPLGGFVGGYPMSGCPAKRLRG